MLNLVGCVRVSRLLKCQHYGQTATRASSTLSREVEAVSVRVGGSGNVQLDLLHPVQRATQRPTILVHIPAGTNVLPSSGPGDREATVPSVLSSTFPSATLISINYRLGTPFVSSCAATSESFPFPQPIHDTSIAFDHIIDEIVPSLFPNPRRASAPWRENSEPRVILIGSHIGRALATMLALTNPNQIHSVAIASPLVDWVILDELLRQPQTHLGTPRAKRLPPSSSAENAGSIAIAAKQLINVRTKLFGSPSAYFDPFASPTLFLRAPGRDTPRTHAEALGMLDEEVNYNEEAEVDEEWESLGGADESSQDPSQKRPKANGMDEWEDLNVNAEMLRGHGAETTNATSLKKDLDTITEAIGADSFGPYDDDHPPDAGATPPSSLEHSAQSPITPPPRSKHRQLKRRKVLRRWPPLSRPEDVVLPYFNVFVRHPVPFETKSLKFTKTDSDAAALETLLCMQGSELVDLLRRACFYGRGRGFGEEKVVLTELGKDVKGGLDEEEQMRAMIPWLQQAHEA